MVEEQPDDVADDDLAAAGPIGEGRRDVEGGTVDAGLVPGDVAGRDPDADGDRTRPYPHGPLGGGGGVEGRGRAGEEEAGGARAVGPGVDGVEGPGRLDDVVAGVVHGGGVEVPVVGRVEAHDDDARDRGARTLHSPPLPAWRPLSTRL